MILKQIELLNFRLHKNTSLGFSEKLNLLIGGNGHGKTTILEAIYYLCTTKNMNLAAECDVVSFGEQFFEVGGFFNDITENNTRILYDSVKNKKSFFLDGKPLNSSQAVIGKFPVVTMIQSDHSITQGSPAERRRFVDSVISQASKTYLEFLLAYNKILRQRSSLLVQLKESRSPDLLKQLEAWTEALVINGSEILKHRIRFASVFNSYLREAYEQLLNGAEAPLLEYESFPGLTEENCTERFTEELNAIREDEFKRASNLAGPHRDDYALSIDGLGLKQFGSQGQHKTFQIALRFGQFFYLKEKIGKTPVFLMDDVFGELDKFRAEKISGYLTAIGQTFITLTDLTKTDQLHLSGDAFVFRVENGQAAVA